jgi:intein/homing endonuclease
MQLKETKIKSPKKNKWEDRKNTDFKVNVDRFLDIDTKEVAYFLGFFWADGYIPNKRKRNRNEVKLEIVKSDLDKIKTSLDKIGQWNYSSRKRNNFKEIGLASTNNYRLINFLMDNDYHNKSFMSADKILSKIPVRLKKYFFRGLIDGDGCFFISKDERKRCLSISSSINQDWYYIKSILSDLNIKYFIYKYEYKKGNSSTIEIRGEYAIKFGEYIYNGYEEDKIGLPRKYNKYLEIKKSIYNSRKEKLKPIKELALRLYKEGVGFSKVIEQTGIANNTLNRLLKKEDVQMNSKIDKLLYKKELGLKLFKEGVSKLKINRDIGISLNALNRHIKLNS